MKMKLRRCSERRSYLTSNYREYGMFFNFVILFSDLKQPRDLIGAEHSGRCTKDNFVGVMFLVYRSIAGLEIPDLLPESFSNAYSSRPETTDPFSNPDHEVASSSPNPDQEDEVEELHRQIHALKEALLMVDRENEDLRSSVQTMHRISRQQTMSHNRMSRNVDTSSIQIARLQADLQDKDNTLARLRASVRVNEDLSRENTIFRLQIEELTSRLEVSHGDAAAQKLVAEELLRETGRLGQQLDELRETSSHVPTVTGDEELQNLINEDLSRENRRLRSKVRELQESFVQLRQPGEELDTLKESARALTRDNQRLHRRVRELEGASAAQDELRRRIEELNTENERMRRDLEQTRSRPPRRQNTTDAPPPAYEAISR
jgi:chromosome segregation ATPase